MKPASQATREPRLESLLGHLAKALANPSAGTSAEPVTAQILDALRLPRAPFQPQAQRLPVCAVLEQASAAARSQCETLGSLIDDFSALEPRLRWERRPTGGPFASANWPEGHANATIVGRGGLETRDDIQIGVSLLAPNVRYPDHRHAPEEIYLVLSSGRFKNAATPWIEPGVGGLFHNPPEIVHAMASDQAPLLAIWCLKTGKP